MNKEQGLVRVPPAGMDIPLSEIVIVRQRSIGKRAYNKLKANIETIGLIDPLCVCENKGEYCLLDGYFRYKILEELGASEAPCLVLDRKDFYTPNRQVNSLSRVEQNRMMHKALEKLDEQTIAESFGLKSLNMKTDTLLKKLHPIVLQAIDKRHLTKNSAREFVYVTPERQAAIMKIMHNKKDYTATFLKGLILDTTQQQRVRQKRRLSPWERASPKQQDLSKKLAEAELNNAFYQAQYHRYTADLVKMAMYIRQVMNIQALHSWMQKNDVEAFRFFKELLRESAVHQ